MNAASRSTSPGVSRWMPAIAAAALLGTVVVAGVAGGSEADVTASPVTTDEETSTVPATEAEPVVTEVTETTAAEPVETRPEVEKVPLNRTLVDGVVGDDVRRVQERLHELGFNPGPVDGVFGSLTKQSIWAFEKLVLQVPREEATGRVTPEMWSRMQDHVKITPRRPEPGTRNHTEVYLPEQVLAVFHDGVAVFVAHMSHGTGEEWCREVTISPGEFGNENGEEPKKEGRCGVSWTPGGVFTYHRKVEGRRDSALGGMLNPVYFNYGIAIHGADNVPNRPASHGCIRIPNALSAEFQSLVSIGERVFVWDGVKEPEQYGEQLPRFDWRWAEWWETSTTSTTEPEPEPEPEPEEPEEPEPSTTEVPETTTSTSTTSSSTTTPTTTTVAPEPDDTTDPDDPGD